MFVGIFDAPIRLARNTDFQTSSVIAAFRDSGFVHPPYLYNVQQNNLVINDGRLVNYFNTLLFSFFKLPTVFTLRAWIAQSV
jgi:hypothetical protein